MAKSRYNLEKLEHMSEVLKAVAHPIRIAIIDLLLQKDEMTVTEIYSLLNIQQPEASRQLKVLKNARLIKCRKSANTRFYYLSDIDIASLLNCIENCSV
jgi:ArsR family transcriptional regulator